MKTVFGILLLLVGAALGLLELLAIVDSAGTKMADDGDPFGGAHASLTTQTAIVLATLASIVGAAFLLRRRRKD